MKVIGAGMDRTGTVSLQTALEILGYPTYHAISTFMSWEKGHLDMWSDYMEGKKDIDFDYIFKEYNATTALPAFLFYRELMDYYPEAKVILTVRDPEAWWNSWYGMVSEQAVKVDELAFLPRFAAIDRMVHNFERHFFNIEPNVYIKEDAIETFIRHNEEVIATVPPERLLVFEVKEGWEPLCNFLGHPIPKEPFPNTNAGTTHVSELFAELVKNDMKAMGIEMPMAEKEK